MSYATWGGTQYAYDSKNKRIWTGNYTCPGGFCGPGYGWQFQSETVFFYGVDGKRLAAYTPQVQYSSGIPQSIYCLLGEERVYFGSKYIGNANTNVMSGGTSLTQDMLGSAGKYFPYGEERNNPQLPNDTLKFATYTRDSATGLDYADQRYYTSGAGRFTNPDSYRASAGPGDPGSWNRFSYTRGDPVNRIDPTGQDDCNPYVVWDPNFGSLVLGCDVLAGAPQYPSLYLGPLLDINNLVSLLPDWLTYSYRMNQKAEGYLPGANDLAKKALGIDSCENALQGTGTLDPTAVLNGLTNALTGMELSHLIRRSPPSQQRHQTLGPSDISSLRLPVSITVLFLFRSTAVIGWAQRPGTTGPISIV